MNEIEKKINTILEEIINPVLDRHLGGAELSSFRDGIAAIRFTGSCRNCLSAEDTLECIIKLTLMERIPEIKDVVMDDGISEELLGFAKNILNKN